MLDEFIHVPQIAYFPMKLRVLGWACGMQAAFSSHRMMRGYATDACAR